MQPYTSPSRSNISVSKLTILQTGTYNPQYNRPYETYIDGESYEMINRRLNMNPTGTISAELFQNLPTQVLAPTSYTNSLIPISQGWENQRLRYIMEVHMTSSSGNTSIYYIQGYTSHTGVSASGHLDPKMTFYINSYVRVTRGYRQTNFGVVNHDIVVESAQVINDQLVKQTYDDSLYKMRPCDVFFGIQSANINESYSRYGSDNQVTDFRLKANNSIVKNSRENNRSNNYLSKILNSHRTAQALMDFGQDSQDIYSRSYNHCAESPLTEMTFIAAISQIQGVPQTTTFTVETLQQLDPNVANVSNFINFSRPEIAKLHIAGQTAYWNSSDRETIAASVLTNAVPSLLIEQMMSGAHFRSTNHDMSGRLNTIFCAEPRSLTNMDMAAHYEMFKKRLEIEVISEITHGNQILYTLEMNCNLFGETWITISLENGPPITYVCPSFCDSLLVPTVTSNQMVYNQVISDFDGMLNNLESNTFERRVLNNIV